MPYFAVLHQYEIDNLEIIISQRKKPFNVVLQLLKYNKTVKNRFFREVASLLSPSTNLLLPSQPVFNCTLFNFLLLLFCKFCRPSCFVK